MNILFLVSILVLYYVYDGYLRLLRILLLLRVVPQKPTLLEEEFPTVTILVTVHNEAICIKDKIDNILATVYPSDKLEVLVASDGSTDNTDEVVKSYIDKRVVLFRPQNSNGKTDTQNQAIKMALGDIVVFTDAETVFDKMFLTNIVKPFENSQVGGVSGHLLFSPQEVSGVSESQGFYWTYELKIREVESALGILAVASGACLAIRKNLFMTMDPKIGEDCVLPLYIVRQGYRMVHALEAIAFDRMEHEATEEFKIRVRMTLRNWQGTWMFKDLLNPLRNLEYAFSLWSHKLLRWLSPVFIILATVASFVGAVEGNQALSVGFAFIVIFFASALLGYIGESRDIRIPVVRMSYSFLLANAGFLVGVTKAMFGHSIVRYR